VVEDQFPGRRRRHAVVVAVVVVVASVAWWAGRATVTAPATADAVAVDSTVVTVAVATVGRSIPVGVTVAQPVEVLASNHLAGVITSVSEQIQTAQGDVLYRVGMTSVRAVQGDVPFYRPLVPGDRGEDVAQLQQALIDLGYLKGAVTGRFEAATAAGLRTWHRNLGMPTTGEAQLGELVAVPVLPAALRIGAAVQSGVALSGGEEAVLGLTGEQEFTMVLSAEQSGLMTPATAVRVQHGEATWQAQTAGTTTDANGQTVRILTAPGGGVVCGQDCSTLPADETVSLRAQAVLVPEVTGPAIPAAAVRTGTDGTPYVVLHDQTRRPVAVLGGGQGLVVVGGLSIGDRIMLQNQPASSAGSAS
jgi:peptidoglycan hydrolase-like protein with peptidoglycan-binding domain